MAKAYQRLFTVLLTVALVIGIIPTAIAQENDLTEPPGAGYEYPLDDYSQSNNGYEDDIIPPGLSSEIFVETVGVGRQLENFGTDTLRQALLGRSQISRDLRIQSDYTGTMTYSIPVSREEIEYSIAVLEGSLIQPFSHPFTVTQIRNSGLSPEDSIVIILLGDGFAAYQYGTWPNPAPETVLWHADNAINAMTDTHPFGLFEDLFTVYVIHTHGYTNASGAVSYLGTIRHDGSQTTTTGSHSTTRSYRIHQLADMVHPRSQQTMVQVISNAQGGTGWAWMGWHYQLNVTISVTSLRYADDSPGGHNSVWRNGTDWQGTFIHEFGHSFGNLIDEHDQHNSWDERRANNTAAPDTDVKWMHWAGHRNVLPTPTRFSNGWAVPGVVGRSSVAFSSCIMRASWGNRNFCGVCQAELVRRMALISGETFIGRSPIPTNPLPNTPIVTMPEGTTRILDSAFHGNTSLNTITIPASVNTIGDFAFIGATGLTTIFNYSTVPQPINSTTFAGVNRANIDLHIPAGTEDAFIVAGWTGFNIYNSTINTPNPYTNLAHYTQGSVMSASSSARDVVRTADRTNNGIREGAATNSWSADGIGQEWLMVDFGRPRNFNSVRIFQNGNRIADYRFEYSSDGINWTKFHSGARIMEQTPTYYEVISATTMQARFVRLVSERSFGVLPIVVFEFEVYYLESTTDPGPGNIPNTPDPYTNLALRTQGSVMSASSSQGVRTADRANNGIREGPVTNSWSAAEAGQEWLMADFGRPRNFNTVRVFQNGNRIADYRFEYSSDGINWTEFHSGTRIMEQTPVYYEVTSATTMQAQFVRLVSERSFGVLPIVVFEFEVYYLEATAG